MGLLKRPICRSCGRVSDAEHCRECRIGEKASKFIDMATKTLRNSELTGDLTDVEKTYKMFKINLITEDELLDKLQEIVDNAESSGYNSGLADGKGDGYEEGYRKGKAQALGDLWKVDPKYPDDPTDVEKFLAAADAPKCGDCSVGIDECLCDDADYQHARYVGE